MQQELRAGGCALAKKGPKCSLRQHLYGVCCLHAGAASTMPPPPLPACRPSGTLEMLVCSYPTTADAAEAAGLMRVQGSQHGAPRPDALKPSMSVNSTLSWTDSGIHSAALAGLAHGPDAAATAAAAAAAASAGQHQTGAPPDPTPSPQPKPASLKPSWLMPGSAAGAAAAGTSAAAAAGEAAAAAASAPGHRRARSQGLGGLLSALTGSATAGEARTAPSSATPSMPTSAAPTPRGEKAGILASGVSSVLDRVKLFDRKPAAPTPPTVSPQGTKPPLPGVLGGTRGSQQPSPTLRPAALDDELEDDLRKLTKRAGIIPATRARMQSTPLHDISSDDDSEAEAELPSSSGPLRGAPAPASAGPGPGPAMRPSSQPLSHTPSRLSGASTPQHLPLHQSLSSHPPAGAAARGNGTVGPAAAAAAVASSAMMADGMQRCASLPLALSSRGLPSAAVAGSGPAGSPSSDTSRGSIDPALHMARQASISAAGTAASTTPGLLAGAAGNALSVQGSGGSAWGNWLFGRKKRPGAHSAGGSAHGGQDWDSVQLAAAVREATDVDELRDLALELLTQRDE